MYMLVHTLQSLFSRDLKRLRVEIELYRAEQVIWHIEKSIANSAGNLCLHLIGNLNTYIGAVIGQTGYVRNREQEFTLKNIPRTELLKKIDETIVVVTNALEGLSLEDLQEEYPLLVFTEKTTTEYLLVHLTTHLTYHLGQVNYHRRLLDQ
jgi:uncharacterized damage-inducible protein DinB